MKKLFNSVVAGLKTKRVAQLKAPLDGGDFLALRPDGPTPEELRSVVRERLFSNRPPAASEDEERHRNAAAEGLVFDLKFRCCGGGRCIYNDIKCRFPHCFDLRPLSKGAEIKEVRALYEVYADPATLIAAADGVSLDANALNEIIDVAHKEQNPGKAEQQIRELVHRKLKVAAYGRPLVEELEHRFATDHLDGGSFGFKRARRADDTVNPLAENETLREEVVSLYIWRAALLVNVRKDSAAVNSLMNLAMVLPVALRTRLMLNALLWAYYSDKEVIFYRSFIQAYPEIDVAKYMAYKRPMMMRRVFEEIDRLLEKQLAGGGEPDDFFMTAAMDMVMAKEVLCIVTSAQAAQVNGDVTEDPAKSKQIPLTLHYFRFHVTANFWKRFIKALMMPPMPPPEAPADAPPGNRGGAPPVPPSHVYDAMGRSMLLHHLLQLSHQRSAEIASGTVSPLLTTKKRLYPRDATVEEIADLMKDVIVEGTKTPTMGPEEYDHYLEMHEAQMGRQRLQQLLSLIRQHEADQQALGEGEKPKGGWRMLGRK